MKTTRGPTVFLFSVSLSLTLFLINPVQAFAGDGLNKPVLPPPSTVQTMGQTDYNWTIRSLDGQEVAFSKFKNKVVFLHFWATWCPRCLLQLSSIQNTYESLKDHDDVRFVVASYEEQKLVQNYIAKTKLKLPIYLHERAVPPVFGPSRRIPRTFIIDRKGNIVYQHIGSAKWDDPSIARFLRNLL